MHGRFKYVPPPNTELTDIHDIYGRTIRLYLPRGDKASAKNIEEGIRQAQLGRPGQRGESNG